MIAVALAGDPALLIADEPIAALDVTMQADLTRLIAHLRRERSMGLIWVTRDLASMAGIVDRVVVVYAGRIMEMASVNRLYESPRHPYTQALFASLPRLDRRRGTAVAGVPPRPGRAPSGCPFAPRCAYSTSHCAELPPLFEIGDSLVACWHAS
jgi:peptide/nickel transport system ATP-binding protein